MIDLPSRFAGMPPYTPVEPFEIHAARMHRPASDIIKLDANENPYGPSPRVRQALAELPYLHIYPDPESRLLRSALAQFTSVPVENLMAGSGADELIDLLLRVLLEPGDRVLICPPTFGMYSFDTLLNAGQVVEVRRKEDFSLDLPAIQRAVEIYRPKVLFLATPNNPDGSLPPPLELEQLFSLPTLVVLDEAYIEFTSQGGRLGERLSSIRRVAERDNLVVLRTFSKWAGLAGLRLGYGAFPSWLLPTLWKAKQPYNVNVAASAAGIASLEDASYLADVVEKLKLERQRLFEGLQRIPYLEPYPSQANFILCRVIPHTYPGFLAENELPALALKEHLSRRAILVRYYHNPLLRDAVRISIGRPENTDAVLQALGER